MATRQLGYPTKNTLKNWHLEYVQRIDSPAGCAHRLKYPQVQKVPAIEHYLENGRCVVATVKGAGYSLSVKSRLFLN